MCIFAEQKTENEVNMTYAFMRYWVDGEQGAIHTLKRYLLLLLFLCAVFSIQAQQKEISYIETTKNWYYIYDESGKKIKILYRSGIGDIKGWGKDFFVTKRGAFYLICDAEGKTLKTLGAQSVGEVVSVSGSTFTSRLGPWEGTERTYPEE